MKHTFKIEFHPLYYFIALLCILTGYFKDFIWISLLIIIHELGHISGALITKWNLDKTIILPFGGMTKLNEYLNRPIYQELIILIMGPIYQMLFFLFLIIINKNHPTLLMYHYVLLLFNFLPIIPLDGSKLVELILELFFSYKTSKKVNIIISSITLIFLLIYTLFLKNLSLFIILIFLIIENIKNIKQYKYVIKKFIIERYLYKFNFKKIKEIKNFDIYKMKRDYYHIFIINKKKYIEKDILKRYFDSLKQIP